MSKNRTARFSVRFWPKTAPNRTVLTPTKDIKTLFLSELYGIMRNHEHTIKLKKNVIRDTKDSKRTCVVLVSESIRSATPPSVTITELDPSDSEGSLDHDSTDFDEYFSILTNTFRRFARKNNFRKSRPLSITHKSKSTPVDMA